MANDEFDIKTYLAILEEKQNVIDKDDPSIIIAAVSKTPKQHLESLAREIHFGEFLQSFISQKAFLCSIEIIKLMLESYPRALRDLAVQRKFETYLKEKIDGDVDFDNLSKNEQEMIQLFVSSDVFPNTPELISKMLSQKSWSDFLKQSCLKHVLSFIFTFRSEPSSSNVDKLLAMLEGAPIDVKGFLLKCINSSNFDIEGLRVLQYCASAHCSFNAVELIMTLRELKEFPKEKLNQCVEAISAAYPKECLNYFLSNILTNMNDSIIQAAQKHYKYMLELYAEESEKISIFFPGEIWKIIFSFMDAKNLFSASLTCRKFRKLALDNSLWIKAIERIYPFHFAFGFQPEVMGKLYYLRVRKYPIVAPSKGSEIVPLSSLKFPVNFSSEGETITFHAEEYQYSKTTVFPRGFTGGEVTSGIWVARGHFLVMKEESSMWRSPKAASYSYNDPKETPSVAWIQKEKGIRKLHIDWRNGITSIMSEEKDSDPPKKGKTSRIFTKLRNLLH